ncbi:MAG TPA: HAD hydrolase-like protein [Chitinophagaceae bacterium]|nr:HAD hydrolase-like protein [Chitinophagaceae bacterium]
MPVRLAVFDIAGTTVADDHAVANAFRKAFESYGYDEISEEDVKPLMGYKKPIAIGMVLEKLGIEWDADLIENIHNEFVSEMMDHYEYSPDVKPMLQAENVFLQLKEKGIKIALNTGFSKDIADVIVSRLQWKERGLIDDYIASDEVEEGRPQPFMIQTLMKRAGIDDSKEVIKIGDTEVDVNEGRNAGCSLVVAVTTGAFTKQQLKEYHPDHIIDDLSQLPALIF